MKTLIFCLAFLLSCSSIAQKKKELKKYKIRCITVTETEGGKTQNDSKEFYNASGEIVSEMNYDKQGNLKTMIQYKYINDKDLSEETRYDEHNSIVEKKTYKYNSMGEKTEEVTKDKNEQLIKRVEYAYNEKGLKSEKRTYDGSGKLVSVKKYNYSCK